MIKKTQKSDYININPDNKKLYLFFLVCAFILYGNTLFNSYSFDDDFITGKTSPVVQKGFRGIPEIFTSRYASGKDLTFGYRPIAKTSFAIEYQFFGLNPFASHFINIILYALTVILLFKILRKLFYAYHWLFHALICLLFLAHPIHTEVVASLKNREELLYFLFGLFSLYLFMKFFEENKISLFLAASFSFILSFLSKQSAVSFVGIIPLFLFFYKGEASSVKQFFFNNKKIFFIFATLFVLFLIVSIVPEKLLPQENVKLLSFENPLHFVNSKWIKYATGLYALMFYLKLIFIPHPLGFYYGYNMIDAITWANPLVIISLILHVCLLLYAGNKFKEKHILSLGIFAYLLALFMFSNLWLPINGIIAERFLYAPSLGFSIALAWFVFKLSKADPSKSFLHNAS